MTRTPTLHEQERICANRALFKLAMVLLMLAETEREQLRREGLQP